MTRRSDAWFGWKLFGDGESIVVGNHFDMIVVGRRRAFNIDRRGEMNALSWIFVVKIVATIGVWCVPLLLFPATLLEALGFPAQPTYLFVRLLGWAYLALCVGYAFGLRAALRGKRAMGPIWVGIVSNAGACAWLLLYGAAGAWTGWGSAVQLIGWASVLVTAAIAAGLVRYGLRGAGAVSE